MGARKFGSLYRSRYSLVVATVSTTTSAVRGSSKQFQKWLLTKRAPPLESTRERFVARSRSSQRSSSSWCRNRSMPPLVLSGLRAPNESSLASTKRGVTHGECECWMSFFRGSVARETRTVRRSPAVGRSSEKHAWSVRGLPGTGPGPGFGHGCCTKHALPSQAGCALRTSESTTARPGSVARVCGSTRPHEAVSIVSHSCCSAPGPRRGKRLTPGLVKQRCAPAVGPVPVPKKRHDWYRSKASLSKGIERHVREGALCGPPSPVASNEKRITSARPSKWYRIPCGKEPGTRR
mmetsp:Transcript_33999/g.108511  ORF Transcript_33999/g.108511 Transcript_33999/m.108511 type:complete len:293 (+) Transcript_33999:613-1491(+)